MKKTLLAVGLAFSLTLSGCGIGGIQDVKAKTENLKTKEELEGVLGKPTKVAVGSLLGATAETYTYETSDGSATFVILNGKIQTRVYGSKESK